MAVKRLEGTTTPQALGRHTRLNIPFRWREPPEDGGDLINLEGYTAEVWVGTEGGQVIAGPREATINATRAEYQMQASDLADATPSNDPVTITCVASKDDIVLPPNKRKINVAEWAGAAEWPGE